MYEKARVKSVKVTDLRENTPEIDLMDCVKRRVADVMVRR